MIPTQTPWRLLPVTLLVLVIAMSGCTSSSEPPLRLATGLWIGSEPFYLARASNGDHQQRIRLIEYVSNTQSMRSLIDGSIDAAALTLDEALLVRATGTDVRIVLVMDYSSGADALVVRPGIERLSDLRGRRIAVETTALGAYMMQRTLDLAGLSLKDVTVVSLDVAQHKTAYLNGTVDAVITFEPKVSHLVKEGAKVLLDTRQLPGEVADVLVVRSDAVDRHINHLKWLLTAWFDGVAHIEEYPRAPYYTANDRMKLSGDEYLKALHGVTFPSLEENRRLLSGNPVPLAQQAARQADIMRNNGLITETPWVGSLFDPLLIEELYAR